MTNKDTGNALALRLLAETAQRFDLPAAPDGFDLTAFGERPRIGRVLDRLNPALSDGSGADWLIGPYRFSPAALALLSPEGGAVVRLTEKERDILLSLLRAEGGLLGREALLNAVWGYSSALETHTLETHIYRLRQKMEPDPAAPQYLLTEETGYRLAGAKGPALKDQAPD